MPRGATDARTMETGARDLDADATAHANVGLVLSGDFESPQQLLASSQGPDEKAAVLDQWLTDARAALRRAGGDRRTGLLDLIRDLNEARRQLPDG